MSDEPIEDDYYYPSLTPINWSFGHNASLKEENACLVVTDACPKAKIEENSLICWVNVSSCSQ